MEKEQIKHIIQRREKRFSRKITKYTLSVIILSSLLTLGIRSCCKQYNISKAEDYFQKFCASKQPYK